MSKETYSIPIGPVHCSLKEPMTFNFEIYGEHIEKVNLAPGDNHRGIEFMGMQRNPVQIIYLDILPDIYHYIENKKYNGRHEF